MPELKTVILADRKGNIPVMSGYSYCSVRFRLPQAVAPNVYEENIRSQNVTVAFPLITLT
jgi:hypothetical protein